MSSSCSLSQLPMRLLSPACQRQYDRKAPSNPSAQPSRVKCLTARRPPTPSYDALPAPSAPSSTRVAELSRGLGAPSRPTTRSASPPPSLVSTAHLRRRALARPAKSARVVDRPNAAPPCSSHRRDGGVSSPLHLCQQPPSPTSNHPYFYSPSPLRLPRCCSNLPHSASRLSLCCRRRSRTSPCHIPRPASSMRTRRARSV